LGLRDLTLLAKSTGGRAAQVCAGLRPDGMSKLVMEDVSLWRERHLLIRLALVVAADLDRHLAVKPFQKVEQLVGGEPAKMPVHQVRHVGLCDA
jgi:pimeloyl-ACP methyl ester carboxylesterase